MKFGKVVQVDEVDFTLPPDHPQTDLVLESGNQNDAFKVSVGFPTWAKDKLPGFYPKGTKDELRYYSSQLNAIEFNASYYRIFPPEQFEKWRDATPDEFRFYPKIVQNISHWRKLKDCEPIVDEYINSVSKLEHKLGTIFLQMHEVFSPNSFENLKRFLEYWPIGYPLAIELRNERWHTDTVIVEEYNQLLMEKGVDNIITDSLGRRDMVHMRLTTDRVFIRFAAANFSGDQSRLDDWVTRISNWKSIGIGEVAFFIHQNTEKENPMLATHFIQKLNDTLGTDLKVPQTLQDARSS
jgi:uncharacterized protein YecE (DUF72 family)